MRMLSLKNIVFSCVLRENAAKSKLQAIKFLILEVKVCGLELQTNLYQGFLHRRVKGGGGEVGGKEDTENPLNWKKNRCGPALCCQRHEEKTR